MTNFSPHEPEREEQLKQLNEIAMTILSNQDNPSLPKILLFIKRTLVQFHLHTFVHEREVFIKAYLRTYRQIQAGKSIQRLPEYLKGVSFNIIREYNRSRQKAESLNQRLICESFSNAETNVYPELEGMEASKVETVLKTFQQSNPDDWEILKLRFVQGLSWQDIAGKLSWDKRVDSLRSKGKRALERLRKQFLSYLEK